MSSSQVVGDDVVGPTHSGGPTPGRLAFRPDVDGLRAIAILLVVGFHAGLPGFSGGFVGVDAFFVISGFLITRNLLTEGTEAGRIGLLAFWGRRIRRLVPAMALMLVTVLVASVLVFSPLQWGYVVEQARAAALYVSNLFYASRADAYFADDAGASVFLHTWSLGVEEQFYVVWPLLAAAMVAATRRRATWLRPALAVAFAVVFAVSLAWSWQLTASGSPWAFFGLPTRAWEFAAGALLAVAASAGWSGRHGEPIASGVATATGLTGIALLVAAGVRFDATTPFPGTHALVPVLGTVLVIVAGMLRADAVVPRVLSHDAMQWLGRVSYSWYLWHWPAILLAVAVLDDGSTTVKVAAAAISLPIAAGAHRFVEDPIRFSPVLRSSRARTFALGGSLTVLVLVASVGVARLERGRMAESPYRELAVALEGVGEGAVGKHTCDRSQRSPSGIAYCVQGDPDGTSTVVLMGDSHADGWNDALAEAAGANGMRLVNRGRGWCPAAPVRLEFRPDVDARCEAYRAETMRLIDELGVDVVVVAQSSNYGGLIRADDGSPVAGSDAADVWGGAYRSLIADLRSTGTQPVAVLDNPFVPFDPLDCLEHADGPDACTYPLDHGQDHARPFQGTEREIAGELGLPTISTTDAICRHGTCRTMIDEVVVYFDPTHLTRAFTLTQVPQVEAVLGQATGSSAA